MHMDKVSAIYHPCLASTDQILVTATIQTAEKVGAAIISVLDPKSGTTLATASGLVGQPIQLKVAKPELWSPDTPALYPVTVRVGTDVVRSYTGFRTIQRGSVDGVARILLNGKPIFVFGTLDQGYWPDGIYTPPNLDAMVWDLKLLKGLGFNMVRKHMKVETALFYHACDQLGLLVIQDMVALRPLQTKTLSDCSSVDILPNSTQQTEWRRQLEVLVNQLRNHPSIFTWVIYNEGWGQITKSYYPEFGLTARVRELDPTRLIDSTSGWHDHGAGDYHDNHHYSSPQCGTPFYSTDSSPYVPAQGRIGFQGEFGGLGNNVSAEQ